jgi:hypothetical protein
MINGCPFFVNTLALQLCKLCIDAGKLDGFTNG